MACRVCPHHPARLHPPLPVLRRDTGPSPSPIPTLRPSHCPPLCQPEGSAALGVPGDGSTHRAGQEHPSSPGTGGISSPAVLCGRGWQRGPREQGDSVGDGGRWAGGGGGGGIKRVPPTSPLGLGLWLRAEPWGRGHLQGREKPTVLSRRRAAGERGTSRTRVTIVPVPGKVPAGREGADGDNRGRILRQSWVGAGGGGGPFG